MPPFSFVATETRSAPRTASSMLSTTSTVVTWGKFVRT